MDFIYGMIFAFAVSLYIHRRATATTVQPVVEPEVEPVVEPEITVQPVVEPEIKPKEKQTIVGTWATKTGHRLSITSTQFLYQIGSKCSYNYFLACDNIMLTSVSGDNRKHHGKFKYENGELYLKWAGEAMFTQYMRV